MTVVIADDNKDIVDLMSEVLTDRGVDVLGKAYNGKEAADLCSAIKPELLLLDIKMPEYDGFYTLREIEKRKIQTKAVIVTAEQNPKLIEKVSKFKPVAIMNKPIDMDKMMKIIADSNGKTRV